MSETRMNSEQLSNIITGEPIGWKRWYSVQNAPDPIVKVCPHLAEDVFIYSNANDVYGLLTEHRILTKPIFAKHFRVVAPGVAIATMAMRSVNNLAIINFHTGKLVFKGFCAYMMIDDDKIAYRTDTDCRTWPNNMKWGVLALPSCEKIMAPKAFQIYDAEMKPNPVPLRDRILEACAI